MSIISLNFFIFFFIIMTIYYLIPGKVQWIWLLLVSLFFYAYHVDIIQTIIFIAIIMINYCLTIASEKQEKNKKKIYCISLILDIFLLSLFKYNGFVFDILKSCGLNNLSPIFDGISAHLSRFEPLHISYFALILIGYITDVYWGKSSAQKNPGKMLLFCSYFPIMTSGPIVRYNQLENQLFSEYKIKFSYEKVVRGLERIAYGLFKKLVISSRAAVIANNIHDNYFVYTGFYVPIGVTFYIIQLYMDFYVYLYC